MRAYLPHFVSNKIEIKELSQTFQNMQLKDLRAFERDTIVQVFGLNPEMLGILQDSNRASIQSAEFFAQKHVVTPRLEFQRLELQERLVPEFDERLISATCRLSKRTGSFTSKQCRRPHGRSQWTNGEIWQGKSRCGIRWLGRLHAIPFQITFGPIEEPEPILLPRYLLSPPSEGMGNRPH